MKRQLLIVEYKQDAYQVTKELVIPDSTMGLAWSGDMLCVAFRREYSLVNSETGEVTELIAAMREVPLVRHVSEDSFLLVAEKTGLWVDCEGHNPRRLGTVSWSLNPTCLGAAAIFFAFYIYAWCADS